MNEYKNILHKYWGYDDFRGIQADIIQSIGERRDTLGLMPTGGGKSITFQIPALSMPGTCIVVTPLIALMKDQVQNLRRRGISACCVYSGMTRQDIIAALENCILGDIKFLYVSPERLGSSLFLAKLPRINVSFITVDEAHCISQWGYDFRPSYLQIAEIRKYKPDAPILALTATATPDVVIDIQDKLSFRERNVFKMSFERKNLVYVVRNAEDKEGELIHILHSVKGSAIVYARSRTHTKEYAEMLEGEGISATYYHAGLDNSTKDSRQEEWSKGEKRVMVATNAFGMGIDKPDVRLVVHVDCPNSLEEYFQEAGRAGRDGERAYAVLLFASADKRMLLNRIGTTYPEKEYIRKVYESLAYFYQIGVGSGRGHTFEFNINKFCTNFHFFPTNVESALNILTQSGYIDYRPDDYGAPRIKFLLSREDLYRLYNNPADEDAVITAILRLYGNLFADYGFVDESYIAEAAGLSKEETHTVLKALSRKHIIHFIPRSKYPYLTYTMEREDADKIIIPPEVYEKRKEQFERRLNFVIRYVVNGGECRSKQLLSYFGETKADECGHCDVCVANNKQTSRSEIAEVQKKILSLLADEKEYETAKLRELGIPDSLLMPALSRLLAEERIEIDGANVKLC
ncbi:MAG: RecQ family ATP-dependent DNA helicase [Prevotella sp.]|nr:RecQ family ATP-dependent DNA helicase [Prevotella sp.]